jgi:hypothetical protein
MAEPEIEQAEALVLLSRRANVSAVMLRDAIADALHAVTRERDQLRAALLAVETKTAKGFTFCAMCDYVSGAGHSHDCIVGRVLEAQA